MTPKTLLSIEEFASLTDDGMKHELNEGELITVPPPRNISRLGGLSAFPPDRDSHAGQDGRMTRGDR